MNPDQFWQLVEQSRLYRSDELESLRKDYELIHGGQPPTEARPIAEWLLAQRRLTGFQARQLLRGKSGPFHFGEYQVLQKRAVATTSVQRFDAVHVSTRHRVVLHLWPADCDTKANERVGEQHREVRHANVDRYYETVSYKRNYFGVTEAPEGETLRQMLEKKQRLPVAKACHILHQAAVGLAHLHACGLVHGCLRPEEIVVQQGGHAKLMREPFFSTRIELSKLSKLRPGLLANYLAPEFHRTSTADSRTDVYALGCILFESIVGRVPFEHETTPAVLAAHLGQEVERPADRPDLPGGLWEVMTYALSKDRDHRYRKAIELAEKLEPFLPAGISETTAKHRPTETLYLSHLEQNLEVAPKHLAEPAQPASVDLILEPSADMAKRTSKRSPWPLVAAAVSAIGLGVVLAILKPWGASEVEPPPAPSPSTIATVQADVDSTGEPAKELTDAQQKQLLWESPTSGEPIDLAYTPAGAQLFVSSRLGALLASDEGDRAIQALGPGVAAAVKQLEEQFELAAEDLERLTIAYTSQNTTVPLATMVGRFSETAYQKVFAAIAPNEIDTGHVGQRGSYSVYFPKDSTGTIVWGPQSEVVMIQEEPGTPPLRREMDKLRRGSDREHHLTILLAPNFLAADGQQLLKGQLEPLRRKILDFIGDRTQAACIGANLGDSFFVELKWVTQVEENPLTVALSRRQQMQGFPEAINNFLGRINIGFWQPMAIRYPLMVQFLTEQTRVGVGDGYAIMNAALPPQAAHNLILAAELALASSDSATEVPTVAPATRQLARSELLEQTIDFKIDQQSLEVVVQELARTVKELPGAGQFSIQIVGRDLQGEGITRNQQIRNLAASGQTVRSVMTQIVRRGNPLAIEDPTAADQKLVWVVDPASQQGLIVTTRTAAERKGYELPTEFVAR